MRELLRDPANYRLRGSASGAPLRTEIGTMIQVA
jgi:hypothetical protein